MAQNSFSPARSMDGLARQRRIAEFEDYMHQYPGAAPGGSGETGISKSSGVTGGLVTSQHRDWSDLLNRQTQYLNDTNAERGRGPVQVNFGGYAPGAATGAGGPYGANPRGTPIRAQQGAQRAQGQPASMRGLSTATPSDGEDTYGAYDLRQRAKARQALDQIYPEVGEERDAQTARTQTTQEILDADYDTEYRAPRRVHVKGDISRAEGMRDARAEAERYFDPNVSAMRGSQMQDQLERIRTSNVLPAQLRTGAQVGAAQIAADSRRDVAEIGAGSRTRSVALATLGKLTQDAYAVANDPNAKPEQQQRAMEDVARYTQEAQRLQRQTAGLPGAAVQPTVTGAQQSATGGFSVGDTVEQDGVRYRITGFDGAGNPIGEPVR